MLVLGKKLKGHLRVERAEIHSAGSTEEAFMTIFGARKHQNGPGDLGEG
jgi:hypothetical protein